MPGLCCRNGDCGALNIAARPSEPGTLGGGDDDNVNGNDIDDDNAGASHFTNTDVERRRVLGKGVLTESSSSGSATSWQGLGIGSSATLSAADTLDCADPAEDAEEARLRELEDTEDFLAAPSAFAVRPPPPPPLPLPPAQLPPPLPPPEVPLRCSALQRIFIEFSVRPGNLAAIWLHLLPSLACVSTMILSSSGV